MVILPFFRKGCNDGGMGGTLPLLKNGKIKDRKQKHFEAIVLFWVDLVLQSDICFVRRCFSRIVSTTWCFYILNKPVWNLILPAGAHGQVKLGRRGKLVPFCGTMVFG